MPRSPRDHQPGATYHVICRGNKKQLIFHTDWDYLRFCELLAEGVERYDHKIVAYCLMPNHVHVVVQAGDRPLSRALQNLLFRYAQGFNLKYETCGHVFQGRFKSKLVDSVGYFRGLIRYVHLNPVKAKLVDLPEQCEWSSHRAYIKGRGEKWLTPKIGLDCFGESTKQAIQSHQEFVRYGLGRHDSFDFDLGQLSGRMRSFLSIVAGKFGVKAGELVGGNRKYSAAQARATAALLAGRLGGITQRELAVHFKQSPTALSKAVARLDAKLGESPDLRAKVEGLYHSLASY